MQNQPTLWGSFLGSCRIAARFASLCYLRRVNDGLMRLSPLEGLGASLFARHNVYRGDAFANHCRRLAAFARLLVQQHGLTVEPGALELVSYVHDLGLLRPEIPGASYMHRSLTLLQESCAEHLDEGGAGFGFCARELRELLLLNHRVLPVPGASKISELYRRAVWIEHSRGLRRYGLAWGEVSAVFSRFPRLNLDWVLLDFGRRTLQKEPLTLINGVFFGSHPPE